ncbi:hypothetical protein BpHYR1_008850 [Brachionus plicatilis]|uniref:Uncharacterized protein n=1 Tax=Brachionus plicatilis TaxID=10195 RepID=A0A3M7S3W9_BRAPC|nr:hypothetical protein BpHYR1_008850 [Brachionus plicatilis]
MIFIFMVTWSNRVPYFFLLRISHPFCSKTSKIVTQFSRNFFFTHLPPRQNKTRVSFKKVNLHNHGIVNFGTKIQNKI